MEIEEPDLTQLKAVLIAPNGLGTFNLFFNRVFTNAADQVVPTDGDPNDPQAVGVSGTDMGYVDTAFPNGPALPDDVVITDEATRPVNDPSVSLFVGDFRQEQNLPGQRDGHGGTFALGWKASQRH